MKKKYKTPSTHVLHIYAESVLALSPDLKDEWGGDQLSTDRNDWDAPEWATDEE